MTDGSAHAAAPRTRRHRRKRSTKSGDPPTQARTAGAKPDPDRTLSTVYHMVLPRSEVSRLSTAIDELSSAAQASRVNSKTTSILDRFPDTYSFRLPADTLNSMFHPKGFAQRLEGKTIPVRFDVMDRRSRGTRDTRKVTLSDFRLDTTHSSRASISVGTAVRIRDTQGRHHPFELRLWPDVSGVSWKKFGTDEAAAASEFARHVLAGYGAETLRVRLKSISVDAPYLDTDQESLWAFAEWDPRRKKERKYVKASRDGDGFLSDRSPRLGTATISLVYGGDKGSEKIEYTLSDADVNLRLQLRPVESGSPGSRREDPSGVWGLCGLFSRKSRR